MPTCSILTSQRWRQCSRQAAGRSWSHPGHTLPCWRREASLPRWALAAGSAPPHGPAGPVMDPTDCWDTLPPQHRAHAWEETTIRNVTDCFSSGQNLLSVNYISTVHVKLYSAAYETKDRRSSKGLQSATEEMMQWKYQWTITDASSFSNSIPVVTKRRYYWYTNLHCLLASKYPKNGKPLPPNIRWQSVYWMNSNNPEAPEHNLPVHFTLTFCNQVLHN